MALMNLWIYAKEWKKLERLGIEITPLQKQALRERVVILTAGETAEWEAKNLLLRLRHPKQDA